MLESKYLKNERMPEVIAKYVEEYCEVSGGDCTIVVWLLTYEVSE